MRSTQPAWRPARRTSRQLLPPVCRRASMCVPGCVSRCVPRCVSDRPLGRGTRCGAERSSRRRSRLASRRRTRVGLRSGCSIPPQTLSRDLSRAVNQVPSRTRLPNAARSSFEFDIRLTPPLTLAPPSCLRFRVSLSLRLAHPTPVNRPFRLIDRTQRIQVVSRPPIIPTTHRENLSSRQRRHNQ